MLEKTLAVLRGKLGPNHSVHLYEKWDFGGFCLGVFNEKDISESIATMGRARRRGVRHKDNSESLGSGDCLCPCIHRATGFGVGNLGTVKEAFRKTRGLIAVGGLVFASRGEPEEVEQGWGWGLMMSFLQRCPLAD